MNCRAIVTIKTWANRITMKAEEVFEKPYDFEATSEQSAKAKITRLANAESEIQDISRTVKGELPDWWTPDPAKWESWEETKRVTYDKNPDFNYCESYRRSRREFVSFDPRKASQDVIAYIRLAWLESKK